MAKHEYHEGPNAGENFERLRRLRKLGEHQSRELLLA